MFVQIPWSMNNRNSDAYSKHLTSRATLMPPIQTHGIYFFLYSSGTDCSINKHTKKSYNRAVSSFECFEGHTFLFQHHRTAEDGWDVNSGIHTMTPVLERKEGYLSRKNTNPLWVGGNTLRFDVRSIVFNQSHLATLVCQHVRFNVTFLFYVKEELGHCNKRQDILS